MKRSVFGMSGSSAAAGVVAAAALHAAVMLLIELPSGRSPEAAAAQRVSVPIPSETAAGEAPERQHDDGSEARPSSPEETEVASAEEEQPEPPEPREPEERPEDEPRIAETADVRGTRDGAETGEIPIERPERPEEEAVASREAPKPAPEDATDEPRADTEPSEVADADAAEASSEPASTSSEAIANIPGSPSVELPGSESAVEAETAAAGTERTEATESDDRPGGALEGVEIVRASGGGPTAAVRGDPNAMPPVVVKWANPAEAQGVARRLSFQIVAVDREGAMLGQVAKVGEPRLISIDRPSDSYSNRARVIEDPLFFGEEVQRAAGGRIDAFWILVPSRVDRALEWRVRGALRRAGLSSSEVAYVEGHFNTTGGEDRLRIDRLHVFGDGEGSAGRETRRGEN